MTTKAPGAASAYPSLVGDPGLTKRELFAAMALQGLLAAGREGHVANIARTARSAADALLAELDQPVTP